VAKGHDPSFPVPFGPPLLEVAQFKRGKRQPAPDRGRQEVNGLFPLTNQSMKNAPFQFRVAA